MEIYELFVGRFPPGAVITETLKWSISALVHIPREYYVCILDWWTREQPKTNIL